MNCNEIRFPILFLILLALLSGGEARAEQRGAFGYGRARLGGGAGGGQFRERFRNNPQVQQRLTAAREQLQPSLQALQTAFQSNAEAVALKGTLQSQVQQRDRAGAEQTLQQLQVVLGNDAGFQQAKAGLAGAAQGLPAWQQIQQRRQGAQPPPAE